MTTQEPIHVSIILHTTKGAAEKTATLLQRGFLLPVTGTLSIAELLSALPGFTEEYIRDRVQTIFVNGLAEDNTARKLIANDTLALSAAMPGLAGAIFRRGGQHSSLRTRPLLDKQHGTAQSGHITLKLFNMIATETGPSLLKEGILIKGRILASFLDHQGERIQHLIKQARIEKSPTTPSELALAVDNKLVLLNIND